MKRIAGRALAMAAAAVFAGCSGMTTVDSVQPNTVFAAKDHAAASTPVPGRFRSTSFGNYEFKATAEGHKTLYGIVPLQLKAGRIVLDALIFAPGFFFNLREVYPYYQIDLDKGVVRYKEELPDEWEEYTPTPEEMERAQGFFGTR